MNHLSSVLPVNKRHMYPLIPIFVYQLVERQFLLHYQVEYLLVLCRRSAHTPDVRCLPCQVLTLCNTAHSPVQPGTPIPAAHDDGFAVRLPERVQHVRHQRRQVSLHLRCRRIVNSFSGRRLTLRQLPYAKVLHISVSYVALSRLLRQCRNS